MASLLLVVKHWQQEQQALEQMRRIAVETSTSPVDDVKTYATAAGDSRKLRGIPTIGRNVAGAIDGTTAGTDAHVERLSVR